MYLVIKCLLIYKSYFSCHTLGNYPITGDQCISYGCFSYKRRQEKIKKPNTLAGKYIRLNKVMNSLTMVNMCQNTNISYVFRIFLKFRKMLWCCSSHDFILIVKQTKLQPFFSPRLFLLRTHFYHVVVQFRVRKPAAVVHEKHEQRWSTPISYPRNVHCHSLKMVSTF